MTRSVFVCTTARHFFMSLLFCYYLPKKHKKLIIFAIDHQNFNVKDINIINKLNIEFLFIEEKAILNRFKSKNWLTQSFFSRNISINRQGIHLIKNEVKSFFIELGIHLTDNKIYLFHDRSILAKYFLNFKDVSLIEDGLVNYYSYSIKNPLKMIFRLLHGYNPFVFCLGEYRSIKQIYLNKPENAPIKIRAKACSLSFIYSIDECSLKRLKATFQYELEQSKGDLIFLTQGVDVAGLCTNKEKHWLYKNIIDALLVRYNKISLKLHPSENQEEYNYFENIYYGKINIIKDKIPFELLSLFENNTPVISLSSSSNIIKHGKISSVNNLINDVKIWREFNIGKINRLALEGIENL